jgi:hypothetical protein
VHNGTDRERENQHNAMTSSGPSAPATHMLLIIVGVLITATAVLRVVRVRVPGFGYPPYVGSMSEQWLAEHRAEQA